MRAAEAQAIDMSQEADDTAFKGLEVPSGSLDLEEETTLGSAERGHSRAPPNYEGWISLLGRAADLKQLGIALAWGYINGHLLFSQQSAGPSRLPVAARRTGELFPLPVLWPADFSETWQQHHASSCTVFSIECWVALSCATLNSMYGCSQPVNGRRPGKVHAEALKGLGDKVERFLTGEKPVSFSFESVVSELKDRRINYVGEEVARPCALSLEQILSSLPPVGHGGSIPVVSFLEGRTKFLIEHPLENLIPLRDRPPGSMQARVHIEKGDELKVFQLLESRWVTSWLPMEEVFRDGSGECLNGLFGVIKPGKFTRSHTPVLRVIMNFIPTNRLFQVICGDVQLLPHGTAWLPLVLCEGEELRISQGDMTAAFYLFALPEEWHRYMAFNYKVSGESIGKTAGRFYRPCCKVLPMGWNSSVGVMQMLSRQLLLSQGLSKKLELHRGQPAPTWFTRVVGEASTTRAWWQVYLDNFMSAEAHGNNYGEHDIRLQEAAMYAWHGAGVLTAEDKEVQGASSATELGIRLDGKAGLMGASTDRIFKTCLATVRILETHARSLKEAQVVLGRWVFILQFRRPAMAVLARAWSALETPWPSVRARNELLKELQMLLCLCTFCRQTCAATMMRWSHALTRQNREEPLQLHQASAGPGARW